MNRAKPQKKSKIVPIVGTEKSENSVPTIFILLVERRKSGEILGLSPFCTPVSGALRLNFDRLFVLCSSRNTERTSHANIVT